MEAIRKLHNDSKRELITRVAFENAVVLDVGCGFGGDLQKWNYCKVKLDMCDPNENSILEAKKRSKNLNLKSKIYVGDIFAGYHKMYDIICYNFSLHYIFSTEKLFFSSINKIKSKLKVGGKFIGCIPDSEKIILCAPFYDNLGNFVTFENTSTGYGKIGEKINVRLIDTPYYAQGPQTEPLAYKDILISHLENIGFQLECWEPLVQPGLLQKKQITKLYSKFIFTHIK
jgi:SAM-dependent methyltransferase